MRKSKAVFSEITAALSGIRDADERESITRLIMDAMFNVDLSAIMRDVEIKSTSETDEKLTEIIRRVNAGEPVQYVLGKAWFFGRPFFVDGRVLIPRPETEELVAEALTFLQKRTSPARILDVGTGSGCIPVTLALEVKDVKAFATDVSPGALAVAAQNISAHRAEVQLLRHDILESSLPFKDLDLVISNPPYITPSEMDAMESHVIDFEPHLALFAPESDPLIFYRCITFEAFRILKEGGMLLFEINKQFGEGVSELVASSGFSDVTILPDMSGNERIVRALKLSSNL